MQFSTILFDLLKSLAWTVAVFGLAFYFRNEITDLIRRLKSLGPKGAELYAHPAQLIENVRQTVDTQTLQEFEGMPRTELMTEIEKSILRDVNLVEPKNQVPLLSRHLAQARLEAAFGRVNTFIFGSQIEGLRKLRDAGGRVTLADAQNFFEEIRARFPDFYSKSSFAEWFSYISGSSLAIIDNDSVQITPLGKEFLLYVEGRGFPERSF
jgi:hypothetical protein